MIYGVGIDIASKERMKAAMERHPRIRERLFTPQEIAAMTSANAARLFSWGETV